MNDQSAKSGGLVFLGLTMIVCVVIVVVSNHFMAPAAAPSPRLWKPVVILKDGSRSDLGESRQMNFWTPSAKTRDYLPKHGGDVAPEDKWQVIDTDDAVMNFGNTLHTNSDIIGYRRTEVWGHGRTIFKPGWWWTVSVVTNYPVDDLAEAYRKYWKSTQPLYIEVIDNRGSAE